MYGADGMTALDEAIITNAPQSYIDYLKSNGAVTRFRDSTQRLATYQQKTQEMQAAQDESDRQVMEIIGTPEQQQAQTIAMINQTGDSIAGAAAARRTPWVPPSSNPQPSVSYPSQSQFQSSASSANSAPSVASAPNPAETIQIHPEALATECIKTSQRGTELIETNNCSKSVWIGCTLTGTYACKAQAAPALSPTGYVYQEAQSIVKIEPHMSLGLPETPPGSELFIAACYDPYSSVYITGFSTKQITRGSKFTVSCHF
jgi:hypothetical protein